MSVARLFTPAPIDRSSKQPPKRPSDEFFIEEISIDDMGYDADIEIIRPDKYEEMESDSEDASTSGRGWKSVDEELAARMRQLGREQLAALKPHADRGRKRRSVEMFDDDNLLAVRLSPDLEVQEIVDASSVPSPAKRRRRKGRQLHTSQQGIHHHTESWTDLSDKAQSGSKVLRDTSTSSINGAQVATEKAEDDDMMDVA